MNESFQAAKPREVVVNLDDRFYDTPVEEFDAVELALDGVELITSPRLSLQGLLERVEQVDLERDAVSILLAKEVRKSSSGLMDGMRQQIDDTVELQALSGELERALEIKQSCEVGGEEPSSSSLCQVIALTQASLAMIRSEMGANRLQAVQAVETGLKSSITTFDSCCRMQIKTSLAGSPQLELFEDGLHGLKLLNKTEEEIFACLEEIWVWIVETTLLGEGGDPFPALATSCRAFDLAAGKQQASKLKQRALQIVTGSTERFLSSPETRSLPLPQFAKVVQSASSFVDLLGSPGCFAGLDELGVKSKLESMLRLRTRIYAQTFQAEGFQAMRTLLRRETWTNVTELETGQEFVRAIFDRLGLKPGDVAGEEEWMLTATLASGIPRQIQRTLDLMTSLPQSASGEAFLGLQIVFDLYLFAICSVFLPNLLAKLISFDLNKSHNASGVLMPYLVQTKTSLLEWISSEEDELCEQQFPLVPGELSSTCLVAGDSLVFLAELVASLQLPVTAILPSIERNTLASRTFDELPQVLPLLRAQCREAAVETWLRPFIYFPIEIIQAVYGDGEDAEFRHFAPVLAAMKLRLQQLVNMDSIRGKALVWDEAVRYFLDRFLDALAGMSTCSIIHRGQMALHLASFWEVFENYPLPPGPSALRAKNRVDDFIKAYYLDKMDDFKRWAVRNKSVYDTFHFAAVFETGLLSQTPPQQRDLKQEFDKLIASF
ncbi:hypothetical protein BASA81_000911 [Batrachochytrium salamandrivorans]|nr:hypothetical protein BASA81_000911 [Batrachochytrium salamandrivorans]